MQRKCRKGEKQATQRWTRCADGALIMGVYDQPTDDRLNSSISFYKNMMGIRSVTAVADNELHLEYDVADGDPIILKLAFDPATRALSNAEVRLMIWRTGSLAEGQVEGTDLDIGEAVNIALANNDPPGLIADVLMLVRSRR